MSSSRGRGLGRRGRGGRGLGDRHTTDQVPQTFDQAAEDFHIRDDSAAGRRTVDTSSSAAAEGQPSPSNLEHADHPSASGTAHGGQPESASSAPTHIDGHQLIQPFHDG